MGKKTSDPPMPFDVETDSKQDIEVTKVTKESANLMENEAEVTYKVVLTPRPQPPFPQRLVKKTKEEKYHKLIIMLEQFSINVPFIKA